MVRPGEESVGGDPDENPCTPVVVHAFLKLRMYVVCVCVCVCVPVPTHDDSNMLPSTFDINDVEGFLAKRDTPDNVGKCMKKIRRLVSGQGHDVDTAYDEDEF